jgi:hypothetical protein
MLGIILILSGLLAAPTSSATPTNSGTSLGTWLTFIAAVLAVVASLTGVFVVRRTSSKTNAIAARAATASADAAKSGKIAADQLDVWRQREETMRMLRWAADNAVKNEPVVALAGVAVLSALSDSNLVQEQDRTFIDGVVQAIIERPAREIDDQDKVVQR